MEPNYQIDPADAVARARAATIAFSKKKGKFWGALALASLVAFVLLLKGMPGHKLWTYLGPELGITLVCLIAVAGFYAVALIAESRGKPDR